MKKLFLLLTALIVSASTFAQIADFTNGYYRVHSFADRYINVRDNKGGVVIQSTTADMDAIELVKGLENVISDPGSIVYFEKHGNAYDFQGQGTGVYDIIQYYVNVIVSPKDKSKYWCYASAKGIGAMYLTDANSEPDMDSSWLGLASASDNLEYRNWTVTPVSSDSENYFGIKPTISYNGKYYYPFFADFPFSFASSGMKAYYVSMVDERRGLVVYREITGVVPRQTPVIIECSSDNPANNKLNIGGSASAVSGNVGKGVLFDFHLMKHENFVTYDKSKMRLLGLHTDGTLGAVVSTEKCVPANTFYIPVSASAPASLKVVSQDEYAKLIAEPVYADKVTINQSNITLLPGESSQLTATVSPDDTTDKTLTWSSDNTGVATVDSKGKVTAVAPGTATITAKCGSVSGTCKVTVNPILAESVTLNKTSLDIYVGDAPLLVATVAPDNTSDKTVVWKSSDEKVAIVEESGRVRALATGTTIITATCGKASAQCTVNVKEIVATAVTLDVTKLELKLGENMLLNATVSPDNTSNKTITWTSSDEKVATVSIYGRVEAVGPGTATITATCGPTSATCEVTVKYAKATGIKLSATQLTMNVGEAKNLIATVEPADAQEKTVIWTSSDINVATISSLGTLRAVGPGHAIITATCGEVSATCEVTVNPIMPTSVTLSPTELELLIGESHFLNVTILPENVTDRSIAWSSSNEAVASVDAFGIVMANSTGTAVITATCSGMSATCTVTVKSGEPVVIILDTYLANLEIDDEIQLKAEVYNADVENPEVVWSTSDPEVATVDQTGLVKAVGGGEAEITATFAEATAVCKVVVNFDSILDILAEGSEFDIYTVGGVLVRKSATDFDGLPAGIYVVNGYKVLVR